MNSSIIEKHPAMTCLDAGGVGITKRLSRNSDANNPGVFEDLFARQALFGINSQQSPHLAIDCKANLLPYPIPLTRSLAESEMFVQYGSGKSYSPDNRE